MLAALLISLTIPAGEPAGQTAPPAPVATSPGAGAPNAVALEPDILLDIRVHADQVRWRQAGKVEIDAHAEPGGLRIEENLSTGVPRPIMLGRTFRDVDWRLTTGARIEPPAPAAPVATAPENPEHP
jgi:hypothetical protein